MIKPFNLKSIFKSCESFACYLNREIIFGFDEYFWNNNELLIQGLIFNLYLGGNR